MSQTRCRAGRRRTGFTLIELLTVIAIIAILAAIIFPVFAAVRENARASSSLSNMHQISVALGQFQLDNHKYPDVLFGYVYRDSNGNVVPMDKALTQAQADATAKNDPNLVNLYFPGLYPEYVKDPNVFTDGDNPITDKAKGTTDLRVNVLCPSINVACSGKANGQLVQASDDLAIGALSYKVPHEFYAVDAYDSSPQISGNNTLVKSGNDFVYVPRYQSSWTDIVPNQADNQQFDGVNVLTPNTGRNDYLHQLRWRNPPAETYVTSTTYHVPQVNKVLVLFESGTAKKLDLSQFQATGPAGATQSDVSDISVVNGVSQANFWKITPNGP